MESRRTGSSGARGHGPGPALVFPHGEVADQAQQAVRTTQDAVGGRAVDAQIRQERSGVLVGEFRDLLLDGGAQGEGRNRGAAPTGLDLGHEPRGPVQVFFTHVHRDHQGLAGEELEPADRPGLVLVQLQQAQGALVLQACLAALQHRLFQFQGPFGLALELLPQAL